MTNPQHTPTPWVWNCVTLESAIAKAEERKP